MSLSLEKLKGEDLFQALVQQCKPKVKKKIERRETRRQEAAKPKWAFEAAVLVITRVHCECGAVHTVPSGVLARFRNLRRSDTIIELADHVALTRPDVEREVRYLDRKAEWCQRCWSTTDTHWRDYPAWPQVLIPKVAQG